MAQWIEQDDDPVARESITLDPWPISESPHRLLLTVAGGNHPTHTFWMQAWGPGLASRRAELPSTWSLLLAEAEADRGPGGEACVIG